MELLLTLIALLSGLVIYLFKDKQLKEAKQRAAILDLELKKEATKRRIEREQIRTEATKVAFNEAKKQFISRYDKHVPSDDSAGE